MVKSEGMTFRAYGSASADELEAELKSRGIEYRRNGDTITWEAELFVHRPTYSVRMTGVEPAKPESDV